MNRYLARCVNSVLCSNSSVGMPHTTSTKQKSALKIRDQHKMAEQDNYIETQKRLDELRDQLERLESLRSVLGDTLTDQKKDELQNQIQSLIDTGGGAVIAGNVKAGGKFVGRDDRSVVVKVDVHQVVMESPDGHRSVISTDEAPLETLTRAYYRSLAQECARLPLGTVDPRYVRTSFREDGTPQGRLHQPGVVSAVRDAGEDDRR
jgi:hypothetical protein